jgi:hypothetical protein
MSAAAGPAFPTVAKTIRDDWRDLGHGFLEFGHIGFELG